MRIPEDAWPWETETSYIASPQEISDGIERYKEFERQYDDAHDSVIDRFLYGGTVHWRVEKYNETLKAVNETGENFGEGVGDLMLQRAFF